MTNTFTHYLVPKEDGMLLGINKFPKVDLSDEGIKEKALIYDREDSAHTIGYQQSIKDLLNK